MSADFALPYFDDGARLDAHYPVVLRICERILGNPEDAADAAQETFRRALQQPRGSVEDDLLWLKAVARNICIDELRRRARRNAVEQSVDVDGSAAAGSLGAEAGPERVVLSREAVKELFGQLTPSERRVLAARVFEGQSGEEVARSLGLAASTVRVLLTRARHKLRQYLAEGHSVAGGIGPAGLRAVHRLRTWLLARPRVVQPRVELVLPALVVYALAPAGGAPGHAPGGGIGGGPSLSALAVLRPDTEFHLHGATGRSAPAALTTSAAAALTRAGEGRPLTLQPKSGRSATDVLTPDTDVGNAFGWDMAASPDFASDHAVYFVGEPDCNACSEVFRSTDGGATWSYLSTMGELGASLYLTPQTYAAGTWYGATSSALDVTHDRGGHFSPANLVAGAIAVAPPGAPGVLAEANVQGLAFIDALGVRHLVAVFPPQYQEDSAPAFLPSDSGFVALQLVQNNVIGGPISLLRCTADGCTQILAIPDVPPSAPRILVSPFYARDHTVVIWGDGLWVSHDGGVTFAENAPPAEWDINLIAGPHGPRLVGGEQVWGSTQSDFEDEFVYSDDWGVTWSVAPYQGVQVTRPSIGPMIAPAPGRLIAQLGSIPTPTQSIFVCSADGSVWSPCTPM